MKAMVRFEKEQLSLIRELNPGAFIFLFSIRILSLSFDVGSIFKAIHFVE
jgi:hypothetical protein